MFINLFTFNSRDYRYQIKKNKYKQNYRNIDKKKKQKYLTSLHNIAIYKLSKNLYIKTISVKRLRQSKTIPLKKIATKLCLKYKSSTLTNEKTRINTKWKKNHTQH